MNERVRGRSTTFSPGSQRREKGALPGEPREELTRTGQSLTPRETEGTSGGLAEAGGSTSIETPLDHAVCQGFGRAFGVEAALSSESQGGR